MSSTEARAGWQFWIDRGGTFTDVVARAPDGELHTHKLLSENPERYDDAATAGVEAVLARFGLDLETVKIDSVRMGTTVATNALLERKGEPVVFAVTRGFGDALEIGYQNRPRLFDLHIVKPPPLYVDVIEIDERLSADGEVLRPLDAEGARIQLEALFAKGYRALAVVLMHGYRHPAHEQRLAVLARDVGFTQVSVGHEVSALAKLVARGDTTVADAYLSPVLRRYVQQVRSALPPSVRLLFMQSNGGLVEAGRFRGCEAVLSGPAGGIVGMARVAAEAGYERVLGFDMGGTSTDVCHFAGRLERTNDSVVAGVRLRSPMMDIHTVAAGGGSICRFDGARLRVGPESAGARPGPACYRLGGPLTITDCNVMLGKIRPDLFPAVFGLNGDLPIDAEVVAEKFSTLSDEVWAATGRRLSPRELAEGFIEVAVGAMAKAVKQISIERGYDAARYALVSFGGAGGQHACLVADAIGVTRILAHPLAGVLSAYGMGWADVVVVREATVERALGVDDELHGQAASLGETARAALLEQGLSLGTVEVLLTARLKYAGTDSPLEVAFGSAGAMKAAFEAAHRSRFGFLAPDRPILVESLRAEAIGGGQRATEPQSRPAEGRAPILLDMAEVRMAGAEHRTPIYQRPELGAGAEVHGPAIIAEDTATTVVEPGWRARLDAGGVLVMERTQALSRKAAAGTDVDPVRLEVFNNLFMAVAEQMGTTLQSTAYSVNIKERLDFSCALFDATGALVANAPHIPVHLGSMGDSVRSIMTARRGDGRGMRPGDVYMLNAPYSGGTHLPDVTVVTPVFVDGLEEPAFYVAARGHHADIGGITPGSMPPDSVTVEEEGVLLDNVLIVEDGRFLEAEVRAILASGRWPARNPDQNIGDLTAQAAACAKGAAELRRLVAEHGLETVAAYMGHVQDNAEEAVRRVLVRTRSGRFSLEMDDGSVIAVAVEVDPDRRSAVIDFAGTSAQRPNNLNAPLSICRAAVLYVLRTLVDDEIPLNDGCLRPVRMLVPEGSMLNPRHPAAVVAGNVETSQAIVDALYGALGVMAAAQGTMNNFTFGDSGRQYYETICGGSGAGATFGGADAVQTHMTNSRLTDPEVLEARFPVLVESFAVRRGSGGRGRCAGGDGVVRAIRFREPMTAAILSNRRRVAPFGLDGGGEGAVGRNIVVRVDGREERLGSTAAVAMEAGDLFRIETPGGGGYGSPDSV
jgi:5-oxoprolinase (ATP-hydrolysing)